MYRRLRHWMRNQLLGLFQRVLSTEDGRLILSESLRGLLNTPSNAAQHDLKWAPGPYSDLGQQSTSAPGSAVFITARFRSGSTVLWNLFRQLPNVTAYYEPLNERRWFDPQARGTGVDSTHRGVDDYWREYDGLGKLAVHYRQEWIQRHLFMDADFWDPAMKQYVEVLVAESRGIPVLQFNRIDFRLPWYRRNFSSAKIIHLYRHPRDQWCSTLVDPACFPAHAKMDQFSPHDKFYLEIWADDLRHHFPFLDKRRAAHPYQLFYYIWRLSYLFGIRYADYSLSYERLLSQPHECVKELFGIANIVNYDLNAVASLVTPTKLGKWRDYADASWFERLESECENILADFLRSGSL